MPQQKPVALAGKAQVLHLVGQHILVVIEDRIGLNAWAPLA